MFTVKAGGPTKLIIKTLFYKFYKMVMYLNYIHYIHVAKETLGLLYNLLSSIFYQTDKCIQSSSYRVATTQQHLDLSLSW